MNTHEAYAKLALLTTTARPPAPYDNLDQGFGFDQIVERARRTIDFDQLEPGVEIPAALLEKITGIDHRMARYSQALMKIEEAIVLRAHHQDRYLRCKTSRGNIVVLQPEEQARRSDSGFRAGIRKAIREHEHALSVDASQLTEEQRTQLEKCIRRQSMELSALRLANGRIKAPSAPSYTDNRPKRV